MKLSVIIPAYNEEGNLKHLYQKLHPVLDGLRMDWKILLIDDGSTDGTYREAETLHKQDSRVEAVSFSRNFGHQLALTAGLDLAEGDAVITMDADLQHPPELISQLVARWREGYEVVYTLRTATEDASWVKRLTATLYYRVFRRLTGIALDLNTADFRLLDRKVVLAFRQIRERIRFLRGLTSWVGFRSIAIPYEAGRRQSGTTKYTFRRMMSFALDGLVSFSSAPLHVAVYLGFTMAAAGFVYAAYALFARIFSQDTVSGWASIIMVSLVIGGIQLLVLGIIGIYIGKMYDEVKQRPLYLIRHQTFPARTEALSLP